MYWRRSSRERERERETYLEPLVNNLFGIGPLLYSLTENLCFHYISFCTVSLWFPHLFSRILLLFHFFSLVFLLSPFSQLLVEMNISVLLILVVMTGSVVVEGATWCIAKTSGVSDQLLQKSLDYACGAGADCLPIQQNGACYSPTTVLAHASYAMNSYFQKKGQAQGACDFSGTASVTGADPSYGSCVFPSTVSAAGTPPATSGPTNSSFNTPPTGIIGGVTPGPSSYLNPNDFNLAFTRTFSLSLLLSSLFFTAILLR